MGHLITVEVKFNDPVFNYRTSMNGRGSDKSIRAYFVGQILNMTSCSEPCKEVFRKCVDVRILRGRR